MCVNNMACLSSDFPREQLSVKAIPLQVKVDEVRFII